MKYSAYFYAKAFAELASRKLTHAEEAKFVKNFLAVIAKNNDSHELKKILGATEKMVREKTGTRKIILESARDIKKTPREILGKFLRASDVTEIKINPDLVAGIRLTVNDNEQFDGSLKRKLEKLFK